jgi:hypothetical protein
MAMATPSYSRSEEIELKGRELDLVERRWALRCRLVSFGVLLVLTVLATVVVLVTRQPDVLPLPLGLGSATIALDRWWVQRASRDPR